MTAACLRAHAVCSVLWVNRALARLREAMGSYGKLWEAMGSYGTVLRCEADIEAIGKIASRSREVEIEDTGVLWETM